MVPVISSNIGRLPPELLETIFNNLTLQDRKVAALVCHQWHQIVTSDRYLSRVTLRLRPSTLSSEWALKRMKRSFRRVSISSDGVEHGSKWFVFRDRVRRLISSLVIRRSLAILTVSMSVRAANEIFGQCKMLHLRKLVELIYSPGTHNRLAEDTTPRVNVFAPNLLSLKIDCLNASCIEFLHLVAPKLRRLVLRFGNKTKLVEAMAVESFDRLRELCIQSLASSLEQEKVLSRDISESFKSILGKLDKLNIRDDTNCFPYVYHLIFNAATRLSYLNVYGIEMHPLALHVLNRITKLEILQLLVDTTYREWTCEVELNLPQLKILLLYPKLMAKAGYLPKLQKFAVYNHSIHMGFMDENAAAALRTFTLLPTIQLVHLRDIVFSEEILEAVCNFRSSPDIVLEDIWDNISVLHRIVNSYSNLKLLRLIHCRFKAEQEDPCGGDHSDDSEWETLQQAESVGQTLEFYSLSKLAELFPRCKFDVHESFFLKQIGRAPWRQVYGGDDWVLGRFKSF